MAFADPLCLSSAHSVEVWLSYQVSCLENFYLHEFQP